MMKTTALSPRAAIAAGAIFTYVRPRLAQDAKIDLKSVLLPMRGGKSFHDSKDAIANAVRSVTKDKLAQDADIDDIAHLLDAIENVVDAPAASVPTGLGEENGEMDIPNKEDIPQPADPRLETEAKDDETPELMAKIREFIAAHVDEDTLAQFDQLVGSGHAEEDVPEVDDVINNPDNEDDDAMSRDNKPMTKGAMDAAIKAAVAVSEQRARATRAAIRAAEAAVRPIVGELAIAYDSADEVYKAALVAMKVPDVDKIHPSAYPTVLGFAQQANKPRSGARQIAQDALPGGIKPLSERIPSIAKIAHL